MVMNERRRTVRDRLLAKIPMETRDYGMIASYLLHCRTEEEAEYTVECLRRNRPGLFWPSRSEARRQAIMRGCGE